VPSTAVQENEEAVQGFKSTWGLESASLLTALARQHPKTVMTQRRQLEPLKVYDTSQTPVRTATPRTAAAPAPAPRPRPQPLGTTSQLFLFPTAARVVRRRGLTPSLTYKVYTGLQMKTTQLMSTRQHTLVLPTQPHHVRASMPCHSPWSTRSGTP